MPETNMKLGKLSTPPVSLMAMSSSKNWHLSPQVCTNVLQDSEKVRNLVAAGGTLSPSIASLYKVSVWQHV